MIEQSDDEQPNLLRSHSRRLENQLHEDSFRQDGPNEGQDHQLVREIMGNQNFTYFMKTQELYKKNQIDHKNGWIIPFSYVPIPDNHVWSAELWSAASSATTSNNKIFSSRLASVYSQANGLVSAIQNLRKNESLKNKKQQKENEKKPGENQRNRIRQDEEPDVFIKTPLNQIDFKNVSQKNRAPIKQTTLPEKNSNDVEQQIIFESMMRIPYQQMNFSQMNAYDPILTFRKDVTDTSTEIPPQKQIDEGLLQNNEYFDLVLQQFQKKKYEQFKFNEIQRLNFKEAEKLHPLAYVSMLTRKFYYIAKSIANFLPIRILSIHPIRQLQESRIRKRLDEQEEIKSNFIKPQQYNTDLKPEFIEFLQFVKSRCPVFQNSKEPSKFMNIKVNNMSTTEEQQRYSDTYQYEDIMGMSDQGRSSQSSSNFSGHMLFRNDQETYGIDSGSSPSCVLVSKSKDIEYFNSSTNSDGGWDEDISSASDDYDKLEVNMKVKVRTKNRDQKSKRNRKSLNLRIDFMNSEAISLNNSTPQQSVEKYLKPLRDEELLNNQISVMRKVLKCDDMERKGRRDQTDYKGINIEFNEGLTVEEYIKQGFESGISLESLKRNTADFFDFEDEDDSQTGQTDLKENQTNVSSDESDQSDNQEDEDSDEQHDKYFQKDFFSNLISSHPPVWFVKPSSSHLTFNQFKSPSILNDSSFTAHLRSNMMHSAHIKKRQSNNSTLLKQDESMKKYTDLNIDNIDDQRSSNSDLSFDNQDFDHSFTNSNFVTEDNIPSKDEKSLFRQSLHSMNFSVNQLATELTVIDEVSTDMKDILVNRLIQNTKYNTNIRGDLMDEDMRRRVESEVVQFTMIGDIKLIYYCVTNLGARTFWQISERLSKFQISKGIIFTAMIHFVAQFAEMYELVKNKYESEIVLRKDYNPANDSEKLKMMKKHYDSMNSSTSARIQSHPIVRQSIVRQSIVPQKSHGNIKDIDSKKISQHSTKGVRRRIKINKSNI